MADVPLDFTIYDEPGEYEWEWYAEAEEGDEILVECWSGGGPGAVGVEPEPGGVEVAGGGGGGGEYRRSLITKGAEDHLDIVVGDASEASTVTQGATVVCLAGGGGPGVATGAGGLSGGTGGGSVGDAWFTGGGGGEGGALVVNDNPGKRAGGGGGGSGPAKWINGNPGQAGSFDVPGAGGARVTKHGKGGRGGSQTAGEAGGYPGGGGGGSAFGFAAGSGGRGRVVISWGTRTEGLPLFSGECCCGEDDGDCCDEEDCTEECCPEGCPVENPCVDCEPTTATPHVSIPQDTPCLIFAPVSADSVYSPFATCFGGSCHTAYVPEGSDPIVLCVTHDTATGITTVLITMAGVGQWYDEFADEGGQIYCRGGAGVTLPFVGGGCVDATVS